MKILHFKDYEDLAEHMMSRVINGDYVTAALDRDGAGKLLRELLCYDTVEIDGFDFNDWDGYDKEYYVTLNDDFALSVEPAYFYEQGVYLRTDACPVLVSADASSRIILANGQDVCREIYIGEEDNDIPVQAQEQEEAPEPVKPQDDVPVSDTHIKPKSTSSSNVSRHDKDSHGVRMTITLDGEDLKEEVSSLNEDEMDAILEDIEHSIEDSLERIRKSMFWEQFLF